MSFTEVENILKVKLIEIIQQNGVLIPLITSSTLILLAVFFLFANVINAYFLIIEKLFRSVLIINNQIFGAEKKASSVQINLKIKKDQPKVVDAVNCGEIENLAEFKDGKLVMCRCWKSSTYPYCDGSHVKHNKETGDNIGPLIIKK